MSSRGWVVAGMLAGLIVLPGSVVAQSRPIKQLPKDLARWSTAWLAIPQEMAEVGLDHGPLAAVTWGPAKGTARMVDTTTLDMWNAVKPEPHRGGRRADERSTGVFFRYHF